MNFFLAQKRGEIYFCCPQFLMLIEIIHVVDIRESL